MKPGIRCECHALEHCEWFEMKIVLFFVDERGACGIWVAGAAARSRLWLFLAGIKYALASNWVLRTGSGRERVVEYRGNPRRGFGELLLQTSVRPSYREMWCCSLGPCAQERTSRDSGCCLVSKCSPTLLQPHGSPRASLALHSCLCL